MDQKETITRIDVASLRRKALAYLVKSEGRTKLTDSLLADVFGMSHRGVSYIRQEVGIRPATER